MCGHGEREHVELGTSSSLVSGIDSASAGAPLNLDSHFYCLATWLLRALGSVVASRPSIAWMSQLTGLMQWNGLGKCLSVDSWSPGQPCLTSDSVFPVLLAQGTAWCSPQACHSALSQPHLCSSQ
jgi:hypothetical protein